MLAVLVESKRVNSCCNISETDVLFFFPRSQKKGELQGFPSPLKENLHFGYWVNSRPHIKTPWRLIPSLLYSTCMFSFGIYRGLNAMCLLQIFPAHNCPKWSRKITRTPQLTHQNFMSETLAGKNACLCHQKPLQEKSQLAEPAEEPEECINTHQDLGKTTAERSVLPPPLINKVLNR